MSTAEQRTEPGLTLPFLDEVERVGFTEVEQQVVLAPMKLRPSKVIEARGGDYNSPEEWTAALEAARQAERQSDKQLHEQHGFPDTSSMNPQQGHFARLAHLMKKYPDADWKLLMQGQDSAMERKPSTPVARSLTIQDIERDKSIYLAQIAERDRILMEGEHGAVAPLAYVLRTIQRKERQLVSYGVDVDELLNRKPVVVPEPEPEQQETIDEVEPEQDTEQGSSEPAAESIPEPEQPVSGSAVIGVNEMAVLLGRSTGTIRDYLQQGRIPGAIQTGGRWTVNREAFEEWLKGKPAVMPTAKEVRAKQPPRPKWDNGDFRPSF